MTKPEFGKSLVASEGYKAYQRGKNAELRAMIDSVMMEKRIRFGIHEHDCNTCTYVGTIALDGFVVDVWHHNHDTIIVRYSSEGSDYVSGSYQIMHKYDRDNTIVAAALEMYYYSGQIEMLNQYPELGETKGKENG